MFFRFFRPMATVCPAISLFVLAFAAPATAQVVVTLTPSFAAGAPGSTVTYQATIQNQSATQDYFFNSFVGSFSSVSGDPNDVIDVVDDASFFGYFQAQYPNRRLPANAIYTGNLADVTIRANAPEGAMDAGTFTISGGLTESEFNALDALNFTITSSVIPETPSVGLLGYGAALLLGGVIVRRRNR